VYDHQPKTFDGKTPVATVHGDLYEQEIDTFGGATQDVTVRLLHTNFVKRDNADAAEDTLDDLLQAVGQVVAANRVDSQGNWQELHLERAQPDYVIVDGEQYRSDEVTLVFTVYA